LINHLLDCFQYIGGIPEEIVIDQDKVMVVSENRVDIIYTKDFKQFIEEMDLKMYVCRKSDPESKGKIENLIKFIKLNFLSIRDFENIEKAKERLSKWLRRVANGKISLATRRIPQEMFIEEKAHLRTLKTSKSKMTSKNKEILFIFYTSLQIGESNSCFSNILSQLFLLIKFTITVTIVSFPSVLSP